jgi:hypothetical protein
MAEEPIRKEDIIDEKGIIASIQVIIDGLKALIDIQMKAIVTMRESAKGMNPSTPEGQSGIKQISTDIDDAAPKIKALNDLTKELTRRQEELAASTGKSNKEFRDDTKALVSAQKALQGTFQETKSVEGSISKLKEELKKLTKEYNNMDGAARGKAAPAIKKLTDELKKAESAIGNNTRNVGNYSSALSGMGTKIMDSIKSFSVYAIAISAATAVFSKLKEAFISTVEGMNIMNVVAETQKQLFYDLATTGKINYNNLKNAAEGAILLNKIRVGDRADMVEFARIEREITKLEFEAADKTKDHAIQAGALNKAIEKQNLLSDKRIADAWEELQAVELLLSKAPQSESLLNKQAELTTKIIQLDDQRFSSMRRNEAKATAFEQAEKDRIQKQHDDLMKAADEEIDILNERDKKAKEARDKYNKEVFDDAQNVADVIAETDKAYFDKKQKAAEDNWAFELDLGKQQFDAQKKLAKEQYDLTQENNEKEIEANKKVTEEKIKNAQTYLQISSQALGLLGDLFEASKQRELSAAGDNAVAREKIEKEYYKRQKAISISQAIINGALAITNIIATAPGSVLNPASWVAMALTAAMTAMQIGVIASQKFAEGGDVQGKSHSQGGTMIEAEKGEYIVRKQSTSKYHDLIEAINQDNPMRIAEEIRNRNFHTVWGGVSAQLSSISRQDPYTRMMYELMKNDIKTYIDSNGDTVLSYPNGSKKVIRKYNA